MEPGLYDQRVRIGLYRLGGLHWGCLVIALYMHMILNSFRIMNLKG